MKIPVITGVIDRRILINYRVDPQVLAGHLPEPFKVQQKNGYGVAGICLIRLKEVRPRALPCAPGINSENAAHRFAVTWEAQGETRVGVYIPRRDTDSLLNHLAGGRIFPGEHHRADFRCNEQDGHYEVELESHDGDTRLSIRGRVAHSLPPDSIFDSLAEASEFFEKGSLGYSPCHDCSSFDGLELRTLNWSVKALEVESAYSSFFAAFPQGSVELDHALLMHDIEHEWHDAGRLKEASPAAP